MYIDADTHVDECEETWDYFPKSMEHLKPATMVFVEGQTPPYLKAGYNRVWFIDGQVFRRQIRDDARTGTTVASRELHDISVRIRDMDELAVDVQVIYPTIFISELTRRAELDVAICKSYNRWISDRLSDSGGRLRWVAVPPLRSIPDALDEIRWAKEAGAVGIYKRPYECDDRHPSDPYFHPVYELAQDLELPICMHVSSPWRPVVSLLTTLQSEITSNHVAGAFFDLVLANTPAQFPDLRWGFIEAGAGWAGHQLWAARANVHRDTRPDEGKSELAAARAHNRNYLKENGLFITCEVTEDLPRIMEDVGDDNLLVGSDYGHPDRASVWGAQRYICERDDVPAESATKLVNDNAAVFYGLTS
jgi:predicted TIM-barrel fold metal-dependent hydrolase